MKVRTAARRELFALLAAGCTSFAGLHLPDAETAAAGDASADAEPSAEAGMKGYREVVLADEPIAYWRFGEASGATAVDESGAHDGAYQGATLGAVGALARDPNAAADFESGSMEVTGASALNFTKAQPFSMEAWVRPRFLDTSWRAVMERLVFFDGEHREGYQITLNATKTICELWRGTTARSVETGALPVDTYTHVVCSYDGSTLRLFVDGTQVDEQPAVVDMEVNAQPFTVGTKYRSNVYFPGTLDEVAVYAKELGASRVAAHYAAATADP